MSGRVGGLLLIAACFAFGADKPKDLVELADMAMAAPPEIAADALIQIAGDSRNNDNAWRIELAGRAFRLATSAKFPYRLKPAVGAARNVDSEAGMTIAALDRGLDTLTLQIRAATLMLTLDRARGRELFESMGGLRFQPLVCRDALMPDVSAYYNLVKDVYARGFTRKEVEDGKNFELLRREMGAIHAPFQLEPAARLPFALKLTREELGELTTVYAAALRRMEADDRSFTGSLQQGLTQTVFALVKLSRESSISTLPLVDGYRSYLARHAGGTRCADSADPRREGTATANAVRLFNKNLVVDTPELTDVRPISEEEWKAAKTDGAAAVGDFWESGRTKALLLGLKILRFGPQGGQPGERPPVLTEEQRKSPDWEAQVHRLLEDLEAWSKDHGESPGAYFHQTSMAYRGLLDLIPPGSLRNRVMETAVSFLAMSNLQRENAPEWLQQVKVLQRLPGMRDAMAQNGNVSLTVALRRAPEGQ